MAALVVHGLCLERLETWTPEPGEMVEAICSQPCPKRHVACFEFPGQSANWDEGLLPPWNRSADKICSEALDGVMGAPEPACAVGFLLPSLSNRY